MVTDMSRRTKLDHYQNRHAENRALGPNQLKHEPEAPETADRRTAQEERKETG